MSVGEPGDLLRDRVDGRTLATLKFAAADELRPIGGNLFQPEGPLGVPQEFSVQSRYVERSNVDPTGSYGIRISDSDKNKFEGKSLENLGAALLASSFVPVFLFARERVGRDVDHRDREARLREDVRDAVPHLPRADDGDAALRRFLDRRAVGHAMVSSRRGCRANR